MAAGPRIILRASDATNRSETWQLLKSPTLVQSALAVADLCLHLDDISFADSALAIEVVDVSLFETIRVEFWGAIAADATTPVVMLYGWHASGPGAHIGTVTLAHGNFTTPALTGWHTDPSTARSIRNVFLEGTAYRGCDTVTVTADYELEIIVDGALTPIEYPSHRALQSPRTIAEAIPQADFNTYLNVSFERSRYKYFGALVTTASATASATLGAIYRPLTYRPEFGNVVRAR